MDARNIVGSLLIVLTPTIAAAQTADELIKKNIAARGGYDKLKAIQTVKIDRIVGGPFGNVKVTIYKKRPALYRTEQLPPGQTSLIVRAIDADTAWENAGGKITKRPPEIEKEIRELEADFDGILVDHAAKGHTVELIGKEVLAGVETYKLKVTLKGGAVREVYLDAKTFLERKHVGTMSLAPGKKVEVILTFSDYRDVGGIKLPFAIDEERDAPGQTYAIYTEKIEVNVPIEDALFKMPSAEPVFPEP